MRTQHPHFTDSIKQPLLPNTTLHTPTLSMRAKTPFSTPKHDTLQTQFIKALERCPQETTSEKLQQNQPKNSRYLTPTIEPAPHKPPSTTTTTRHMRRPTPDTDDTQTSSRAPHNPTPTTYHRPLRTQHKKPTDAYPMALQMNTTIIKKKTTPHSKARTRRTRTREHRGWNTPGSGQCCRESRNAYTTPQTTPTPTPPPNTLPHTEWTTRTHTTGYRDDATTVQKTNTGTSYTSTRTSTSATARTTKYSTSANSTPSSSNQQDMNKRNSAYLQV